MKNHESKIKMKASNTFSINKFKTFEIAKSKQRLLKGGSDIITEDTVDN